MVTETDSVMWIKSLVREDIHHGCSYKPCMFGPTKKSIKLFSVKLIHSNTVMWTDLYMYKYIIILTPINNGLDQLIKWLSYKIMFRLSLENDALQEIYSIGIHIYTNKPPPIIWI